MERQTLRVLSPSSSPARASRDQNVPPLKGPYCLPAAQNSKMATRQHRNWWRQRKLLTQQGQLLSGSQHSPRVVTPCNKGALLRMSYSLRRGIIKAVLFAYYFQGTPAYDPSVNGSVSTLF
ncbi:hypothetical protein BaRGS_00027704 [Batillaria attramentaria]|uniref:Uncharacterized protein n=1 Tax=Batillaria attramentaria TaxID=370345 RepID=A0ABD0K1M4_9CAEN